MKKHLAAWAASLLMILAGSTNVRADGMPIDSQGRFVGGETIVIGLSETQQAALAKDRVLKLNAAQRRQIRKIHGFSPSELHIYDTRVGENDCTCEAYNRGLWFNAGLVEVPRTYLVTDQRAREIEKAFREM